MRVTTAVLFDGGNTLLELDYHRLSELARSLGASASPEDVGVAAARLLRRNSSRYGKVAAVEEAADVFLASFQAVGQAVGLSPDAASLFAQSARADDQSDPRGLWRCPSPGASSTLASLRDAGLMLGVISNSDGRVEQHLALAGLRGWFDVVIDSSVVGVEKPDARIFETAIKQMGVPPERALYVGDLLDIDIHGARNAGLRAVLYDRWDAYPEVTGARVRSLAQLPNLLRNSAFDPDTRHFSSGERGSY